MSTELTTTTPGALALPNYGTTKAAGRENTTAEDFAIPFLNLLQDLSPEVKEHRKEDYIPGAKPGLFFNTISRRLYGAEVILVPCVYERKFIEWIPRDAGGGLVGVHEVHSPVVAKAKAAAGSSFDLKNGANDLIDTRSLYCLVLDQAGAIIDTAIVPFTSTKLKTLKAFMSRLNEVDPEGKAPFWAFRLRLRAFPDQNKAKQDFFNVELGFAVEDNPAKSLNVPGQHDAVLLAGKAFYEGITSGAVKVDHSKAARGESDDTKEKADKLFS